MKRTEPQTNTNSTDAVRIYGAREHNLKNIDATIPHGRLTVITGLSGCGKSSLAFDTVFAEGQRRYIETFSSYARGMLGALERPDVDKITGLSPVISIEQKTTNRNPRSTVGTTTEIYDFLRLLYARTATPVSYISGKPMVKYTQEQIVSTIAESFNGKKIYILAPLVKNRKGHYRELFETLQRKGYMRVRIDGQLTEITPGLRTDRYKNHDIELVIDRMTAGNSDIERLNDSVQKALKQGEGQLIVLDAETETPRYFSRHSMDPDTGISYPEAAPHSFSFNSPLGACPRCKGLGYVDLIDIEKIIPDKSRSIHDGAIVPLGRWHNVLVFWQIEAICKMHGVDLRTPVNRLPTECLDEILHGTTANLKIANDTMALTHSSMTYDGIVKYIDAQSDPDAGNDANRWSETFFSRTECPECHGARINLIARHYYIDGKSISDLCDMDISALAEWTSGLEERIEPRLRPVAHEILKEINPRLQFLCDVGLGYLQLGRSSASLSGGESQRIRLASQIGSRLVNVLYILDEPSIGLHQSDNQRLINSLKSLRDIGNSVVVVEHDEDMMRSADWIIDLGPGAGQNGGEIMFEGTPEKLLSSNSPTADYLSGKKKIEVPTVRRPGNGKTLKILGASGHNLHDVDLTLELGTFTCVAGVSGSGKSSLIQSTLQPILTKKLYRSHSEPLPYRDAEGLDYVDKIVTVDQSPLSRSPRSNPATYTGVFTDIRKLFVELPEAKIRGYKPGRFSFNIAGGRCETCKGTGYRTVEMNFLPDVDVPCPDCRGKRYSRELLEVRYKGKSIADVLDMTIDEAVDFFANVPNIVRKIRVLKEIGLGYLKLGQPTRTLSGGENQRVKLASELSKRDTGHTLYILDEPTTGLHFEDIRILLGIISRLVDRGNTVVVIEHNIDVIKSADRVIDLGPGGGRDGGYIIASGTPEEVAASNSPTAPYLAHALNSRTNGCVKDI